MMFAVAIRSIFTCLFLVLMSIPAFAQVAGTSPGSLPLRDLYSPLKVEPGSPIQVEPIEIDLFYVPKPSHRDTDLIPYPSHKDKDPMPFPMFDYEDELCECELDLEGLSQCVADAESALLECYICSESHEDDVSCVEDYFAAIAACNEVYPLSCPCIE